MSESLSSYAHPDVRTLTPPGDQSPEQWLSIYDNTPTTLPRWETSPSLAVVAVDEFGEAVVVLSEKAASVIGNPEHEFRRLFFVVPRSILLGNNVCPSLKTEDWQT